jgi:DNA repair protein SbcC/Rad50
VARTDSGFTPEVAIDGEPTPAEALSGGERTSLALAFRLALATVVRTLGNVRLESLLLDEPTDGFSAEQVVRMGELLEELGLPQVVVVSHEAQLASIADRVVRVRKDAGRSKLEPGDGDPREEAERPPSEASPGRPRSARRRPAT